MAEDDKGKSKKAEEAKEKENISKYREAFEQIRKIVGTEASLEKITSDFVRIEDANFALFNYVTEMNNQVRSQSYELTRGPPELVQHFRLPGEFTSPQERCMS
jgi:hypothetical protein